MTTAIILAAGKSERMGNGADKAFISLVNKPVVAWSLIAFERCPDVDRIILVVRKEQLIAAKAVVKMFGISKIFKIIPGGSQRQESVQAGLEICDIDTRLVVIHDAARPCVTSDLVSAVLRQAKTTGAATLGCQIVDSVKRCAKGTTVSESVPRDRLWAVQTPQAFQIKVLREAFRKLPPKTPVTDDCQVVELAGGPVKIVENLKPNLKITTVEDLQVAGCLLK